MVVDIPSVNLSIIDEQEYDALVEGQDALHEEPLCQDRLREVFSLHYCLVVVRENKAAHSVLGAREYDLHGPLLEEANVKYGPIVRVLLNEDILVAHLHLEVALHLHVVMLDVQACENSVWHVFACHDDARRVLVLFREGEDAIVW